MKGMREMAEEQTQNFQKAAFHLAKCVIEQKGQKLEDQKNIAAVISNALELTNGSFIDEDELQIPSREATFHDNTKDNSLSN